MTLQARSRYFSGVIALILLIATFFAIFTVNTQAQSDTPGGGLRIPPGPIPLDILPGESKSFELPVRNIVPTPLVVSMEVNDFTSDGFSGDPKILLGEDEIENNPYSLKPYVDGPSEFELDIDEEKILQYTITLPNDATPGARYGLFRFIPRGGEGSDQGVSLTASLGTIIIVNTPGDAKEVVNFVDMWAQDASENRSSLFQSAPEKLIVKLKNDGDTFVQPFGTVRVKNWSGDTVLEYEFNEAVENRSGMLPNSEREFNKLLENVDGYGKYTVEATISYGDGSNIIPASTTFWVLPWITTLIAVVILLIFIFALFRGVRWYNRRLNRQSKSASNRKK